MPGSVAEPQKGRHYCQGHHHGHESCAQPLPRRRATRFSSRLFCSHQRVRRLYLFLLCGGPFGLLVGAQRLWFLAPDVLCEPLFILFHHCSLLLRLCYPVAEPLVDHHFYWHTAILECLPQFVSIGNRHAPVILAVLDERRRLCFGDIRNRRRLL